MSAGQREVIIILGKTGYGKSTWLQSYAQGLPRIFAFDPFKAFPADYISEEQLIENHENGAYRSANFRVGNFSLESLDILGSIAYVTGNCAFIIEECGVAFYKGERIPDWLQECIFLGRHQSLSIVLTAQRAASIPIELRSQASRFITFRQSEKNDVKWCADYVGELFDQLPLLERFECIDADNNDVTRYFVSRPSAEKPDLRADTDDDTLSE